MVGDVALDELEPPAVDQVLDGLEAAGVSELVEHDDPIVGMLRNQMPREVRPDEAGAAGDHDLHALTSARSAR